MNDPYRSGPSGNQPQYPPYSSVPYQQQQQQPQHQYQHQHQHQPPAPDWAHGPPPPTEYQSQNPLPDSRLPPAYFPGGNLPPGNRGNPPLAPGAQPDAREPLNRTSVVDGRKYELVVMQQPVRARMCGFGDKDRRPITPPPCVRLKVTDAATGKEIDCSDIEHSMFIISVDLWSECGRDEVNLVRHSMASPSISATSPISYAEAIQRNSLTFGLYQAEQGLPFNSYPGRPQVSSGFQLPSQAHYQHNQYTQPPNGQHAPPNGHAQQPQQAFFPGGPPPRPWEYGAPHQQPSSHQFGQEGPRPYPQQDMVAPRGPLGNSSPQGMFTRNLIGQLATSAFRLIDTEDRIGIWFVLQDLSVRTEGSFRLRFSFVNLGVPPSPANIQLSGTGPGVAVNTTKAPVLSTVFSDVFTVYSAKRFPGVVESTELSKIFSMQGIKIPIRKDALVKGAHEEKDDDE
ncbi:uncharacterized protein L3040_008846 [Drepanopeziza brunnea f. sp. 'multigermtubi']|nr:hypothetical protein L3040_008846 [Drepanopeziza brunnea f. sp. 'multigermtubi']